jgi:hypothetical protein
MTEPTTHKPNAGMITRATIAGTEAGMGGLGSTAASTEQATINRMAPNVNHPQKLIHRDFFTCLAPRMRFFASICNVPWVATNITV